MLSKCTKNPICLFLTLNILFLLVTLAGQPASAAGDGSPSSTAGYEALVNEALDHYAAKEYEQAIVIFKKAYSLHAEPELVYNIARSYERMVRAEEALEWYQKFLDMPGTTGELRTRALNNIAALREEAAARQAAETDDPSASSSSADTENEVPSASPYNGNEEDSVENSNSTATGTTMPSQTIEIARPLRIAGWIVAGTGVAMLAVGSTFGILAGKSNKDFEDAGVDPVKVDYLDEMQRNALLSDIFIIGGATALCVGVSLIIVNKVKNRRAKKEQAMNYLSPQAVKHSYRHSSPKMLHLKPMFLTGNGVFAGGLVAQF